MKILLSRHPRYCTFPSRRLKTADAPLGLAYVAAYIEERTDHEVKILDCHIEGIHTIHGKAQ